MSEKVIDEECTRLLDECIEDEAEIVSIRCRRHKRRFNVPKDWTNTSNWLCPRCYQKLTSEERLRYAPPEGIVVEVRPAEEGKSTLFPTDIEKIEEPIQEKQPDSVPEERVKQQRKVLPKKEIPAHVRKIGFSDSRNFSPTLAALMPKHSIECKKCRQIKPVHSEWIETKSKVLCPECFFGMSATERMMFHKKHPATKAKVNTSIRANEYKIDLGNDVNAIVRGGRLSNDRIMHMTKSELIQAVREGKVSRPRARIELNRRRKAHYYSDLPDIERATPAL